MNATRNLIAELESTIINFSGREGGVGGVDYSVMVNVGEFLANATAKEIKYVVQKPLPGFLARNQNAWHPYAKDGKVLITTAILNEMFKKEAAKENDPIEKAAKDAVDEINDKEHHRTWDSVERNAKRFVKNLNEVLKEKNLPEVKFAFGERNQTSIENYLRFRESMTVAHPEMDDL